MHAVVRLHKGYLALGLISLLFFVGMGTCSSYFIYHEVPEDRRIYAVVFFLGFWGFMACLSLWVLIACWRESLTMHDEQIVQKGILSTKEFKLNDFTEAHWRAIPVGGSIVLKAATGKMKIYFHNFEREQSLSLIRYFRGKLPQSIQHGWPLFCYKVALPLRKASAEDEPKADREPNEDETRIPRQRWDWYFLPGVVAAAGIGVYLWRTLGTPQSLLAPLPLVLLWSLLRWATPKRGMIAKNPSACPEERRGMTMILGAFVLMYPLMFLGKFLERRHPTLSWIVVLPLAAMLPFAIREAYRKDRRQKERDLQAAPADAEEWERTEAASLNGQVN